MDSTPERLLRGWTAALYVLLVLLVFYGTERPTEVKTLLFVGGVALLALGWLRRCADEERLRVERSVLGGVLLLNVVVWTVTVAASPYPVEGLPVLGERLAGVGLLLLVPALLRRQDLPRVVGLLLAAVALMSAYGLLQWFRLDPFLRTDGLVGHFRVCSTTDHPNIFVSVLVAAVPMNVAAFRLFGRSTRWRLALVVLLVLDLGAAGATLSRAGWAALLASLLLSIVGMRATRGERAGREGRRLSTGTKIRAALVVAAVAVAALVLAAAMARVPWDPGERERLLDARGSTVARRLLIYRGALRMSADAPILGHGPGTFALLLPGYRGPELAQQFPENAYHVEHAASEPLEVMAESGACGLLAWLLLVGVLVCRPLRAALRASDPGLAGVMVAGAAGTAGLVLHGLAEVSLRYQPPLFLLFALPALALAAERALDARTRPKVALEITRWPGRLALGIGIGTVYGLAFVVALATFVASYHVRQGRRAERQGDLVGAEREFRSAQVVWPGSLPARYLRAHVLWRIGQLARAEAEYRELVRRSPYYFDVNHNLARLLFQQGKRGEARAWADLATRINPYHVPSHELAVRIALDQGRVVDAERLAQHICGAAADDPRTRVVMARVRVAQGRLAQARQLLEDVVHRSPKDKDALHLLRRLEAKRPM